MVRGPSVIPIRRLGYGAIGFVSVAAAFSWRGSGFAQSQFPSVEGPVQTVQGKSLEARVGTVTDVGIDPRLNIYVLDGLRGAVDVFRWDGSFVAEASLDSEVVVVAKAMAVTATGRIFVLPDDGHKLIVLQLEGTTLRRLSWFPISVAGGDVCAGRRSVFVIGFDPQSRTLVHEYGFDGRPGRKFGATLASDAPGSAVADFQGRIACGDGAVAVGSGFSPTVELYDDEGGFLWRGAVRPYRSMLIQALPPDGYSLAIPPGGVDVVLSVLLFHRTVAVQLRRSGKVVPDLATVLFPTSRHNSPGSWTSSWPLIRRVYAPWALATAGRPHLAIALYRVRGRSGQ